MTPVALDQLRRLTRPVSAAGPLASAIAVYAEPLTPADPALLELRAAKEQGAEGVACVDDAARAIVLYCMMWRRYHSPAARDTAHRLLRFLAYMQDDDGQFVNFILDWTGKRNRQGSTSHAGGPAWQARALHALAWGAATLGGTEWTERFDRAVPWVDDDVPYLDARAVCVLAALEHWRATQSSESADRALAWSREIGGHTNGSSLLNAAGVQPIHLWGHLQEAALAQTGQALDHPELVECARASAEALLLPVVDSCFDSTHVLPFDVSCTVAGLAAVARATSDAAYASAAMRAREWFLGRNSARQPVYDAPRGMVFDGIDNGRVSQNSGAESNIEGALALLG